MNESNPSDDLDVIVNILDEENNKDNDIAVVDMKVKFYLRCIKIGCFENYPPDKSNSIHIISNMDSLFFIVRVNSSAPLLIAVKANDVQSAKCYFSNHKAQYLFLELSDLGVAKLKARFASVGVGHLLLNPSGQVTNVITFLLDESIPSQRENLMQHLYQLFPCQRRNIITNVTWEDVNAILTYPENQQNNESPLVVRGSTLDGALSLELHCDKVNVGLRVIVPMGRMIHVNLRLTSDSFSLSLSEKRSVSVVWKFYDVLNLAGHFAEQSTIFMYSTRECARNIRFQLCAIKGGHMQPPSAKELEMYQRITFHVKNLTTERIALLRRILHSGHAPQMQEFKEAIPSEQQDRIFETFMRTSLEKQMQNPRKNKRKRSSSSSSTASSSKIISVINLDDDEESANVPNNSPGTEVVTNNSVEIPQVGAKGTTSKTNEVVCITIEEDDINCVGITPCKQEEKEHSHVSISNCEFRESKDYGCENAIIGKTPYSVKETPKNSQQFSSIKELQCTKNNVKGGSAKSNRDILKTTVSNRVQALANSLGSSTTEENCASPVKNPALIDANNHKFVIKNKNDLYFVDIEDGDTVHTKNDIVNNGSSVIANANLLEINCRENSTSITPRNPSELTGKERHAKNKKNHVASLQDAEVPQNSVCSTDASWVKTPDQKISHVPHIKHDIDSSTSRESLHFDETSPTGSITETDTHKSTCFNNIFDIIKMRRRNCRDLSDKSNLVVENQEVPKNEESWDTKYFDKHITRFPFLYADVFRRKRLNDPTFSKVVYRAPKKTEPFVYFESWFSSYKSDPLTASIPKKRCNNKQSNSGQTIGSSVKRKVRKRDPIIQSYRVRKRKKVVSNIANQQSASSDLKQTDTGSEHSLIMKEADTTVSPSKCEEPESENCSLKIVLKRCNNGFKSSIQSKPPAKRKQK